MEKKNIPAVSIVIPMYNAEKYIGECLDSILAQTFTDYEVIVVDDCSTDNSVKVLESYLPKFNQAKEDKLKIVRRKINSGASGVPRYEGLLLAQGEYISFIDSEDLITPTAIEELYPIAKNFEADVVHCEKFYKFSEQENLIETIGLKAGEFVNRPTLITDDLGDRVNSLYNLQFVWNLWTKLIRRKFIMENDLKMINGIAADAMFTCLLVCSAKRYVRVPNIINFYRVVENSISNKRRDISQKIHTWINSLIQGFQVFDKFLSGREFFKNHPDVKHLALEVWVRECCGYLQEIYSQIPAWQIDEIIRKEFEGNALMAFLFSRMNVFNVSLNCRDAMIKQMDTQIKLQNSRIKQFNQIIQHQNSTLEKIQHYIQQLKEQ